MPFYHFINNQLLRLEGKLYSGNLSETQFKIESALDKTQSLVIDLDLLERFDEAGEKARENNKEIILFCKDNAVVKAVFAFVGIEYSSNLSTPIF